MPKKEPSGELVLGNIVTPGKIVLFSPEDHVPRGMGKQRRRNWPSEGGGLSPDLVGTDECFIPKRGGMSKDAFITSLSSMGGNGTNLGGEIGQTA